MKIYGLCLIKNEIDIIEYCLTENSKWTDKIIVYDNGSDDGTWELVLEMAEKNLKIVPFKTDGKPYHDGLRGEAYNAYKNELQNGDWWAIVDADEFFMVDPRNFLESVPKKYHKVKTKSYEYLVTKEDADEYTYANNFIEDKDKLKYYKPQVYSEVRFMRHRDRIVWIPEESRKWPKHSGLVYPKHIPLKHYQYRSPDHIKKRLVVRQEAAQDGYRYFKRDLVKSWEDIMLTRSEAIKESPEMTYRTFKDVNVLPPLGYIKRRILHALGIFP